jgi:hypothetical protein
MRALAVVFVAACCPWYEGSEYVPVRVAVYSGPAEATITGGPPAAPSPCDRATPDISTCTPVATVRVRGLSLDPRCFYDNKVSDGEIGRVMQCPGETMVVFEHARFVGEGLPGSGLRPDGVGFVDACAATTYDFPQGDNCTWRTEQRIEGPLSGPMTYSYTEAPVGGADCTLACRTTASLDVVGR